MPDARRYVPDATVVRGVLWLRWDVTDAGHDRNPPGDFRSCPRPMLLDASGRKVADLHPGANDLRSLPPGVYFVRKVTGRGRDGSPVRKVIIAR
ncbi:T9SS type A sorting domain-containing protein [candidate division WOR-3 bacterium]|nr:T9SS type A sorting domain-containing protein [candidate division WOR-3 bacterium]